MANTTLQGLLVIYQSTKYPTINGKHNTLLLFLLLVQLAPEIRWDPPYPLKEKQGYILTSYLNDHPVLDVSFLRVTVTKEGV